mmetsp:Transcript_12477/g.34024  ORF Transcript_12477/g.34024 Transcript_12477/m.34024 type:complete len:439 (-) Transcript_12477:773-2089(-)|eukprot:scaffold203746_cov30-Tisochrysis_lutea.AAC.4
MSRASVGNEAVQKWAQALTTQAGCTLYGATAAVCILLHHAGKLPMSYVGLVLLQASALQRAAMDLMMRATRIETEFVSVERLAEYSRLEPEEDAAEELGHDRRSSGRDGRSNSAIGRGVGLLSPPVGVPLGRIELRSVVLRYRVHLPPVLRGVTLTIAAGTKIALCGRTGSGKSSMLGALTRLYPIDSGEMRLDGVDLTTAPLAAVRACVRVVAQEALLLDGSLLLNLLAFSAQANAALPVECPADGTCGRDAAGSLARSPTAPASPFSALAALAEWEAWAALETVGLRTRVSQLRLGLHTPAAEADLSDGERQLFSLARGLLFAPTARSTSVLGSAPARPPVRALLCDEPTANVDPQSDAAVHTALLGLNCTVVVVAHRLAQTQLFDRVAVMEAGTVIEEGPPGELLKDSKGRYSQLCARANATKGDESKRVQHKAK